MCALNVLYVELMLETRCRENRREPSADAGIGAGDWKCRTRFYADVNIVGCGIFSSYILCVWFFAFLHG